MNGRYLFKLLFLIVCSLGTIYLALEAVLQMQGTSICATEACRTVATYSRFGDLAFVLAGLGAMLLLAVLAYQDMRGERGAGAGRDRIMNAVLVAALAAEGFFAGYQLLWLSMVCVFCLSVFGLFVTAGILRAVAGHHEVFAGFGALAVILLLFVAVLPAGGPRLPKDAPLLLFYSTDCKHCTEIRKDINASGIDVTEVLIRDYATTLGSLGIDEVPTLLVNGLHEKIFLTGTGAIRAYLASCRPEASGTTRSAPASRSVVTGAAGGTARPPVSLNLFPAPATPAPGLSSLPDDGLCKEERKCD